MDLNNMSRRDALKTMGMVTAAAALTVTGIAEAKNFVLDKPSGVKKDLKVLAINGSSRKDGNTYDMLNIVLDELKKEGISTELIQLAGETINPCRACFACGGKGNCVHDGDKFQTLYEKMKEADAIVLGTSTYSADVSSTLKAVIERASVVCDMNPGIFRHKVGGGVAVARRAGAMNAIDSINHFFLNKEMFVVGSTYWNIAYGRLPGEALNDSEAVENMKNLGQNMAWILLKINS